MPQVPGEEAWRRGAKRQTRGIEVNSRREGNGKSSRGDWSESQGSKSRGGDICASEMRQGRKEKGLEVEEGVGCDSLLAPSTRNVPRGGGGGRPWLGWLYLWGGAPSWYSAGFLLGLGGGEGHQDYQYKLGNYLTSTLGQARTGHRMGLALVGSMPPAPAEPAQKRRVHIFLCIAGMTNMYRVRGTYLPLDH